MRLKQEPDIDRMIACYGDSLLRMSFLYLKDYYLAQDAVQETFLKAYKKYQTFEGKSAEKTWLIRININICKNMMRTGWWKKERQHSDIEQHTQDVSMPDDTNFAIKEVVINLPEKYKEVILLFYYQELKIREIAEILHIPESTVSTRLKRARERIKNELKEDCFDESDETSTGY